eukprot:scaffold69906_cov33-Tisochrysis_lutea.AAC.3
MSHDVWDRVSQWNMGADGHVSTPGRANNSGQCAHATWPTELSPNVLERIFESWLNCKSPPAASSGFFGLAVLSSLSVTLTVPPSIFQPRTASSFPNCVSSKLTDSRTCVKGTVWNLRWARDSYGVGDGTALIAE